MAIPKSLADIFELPKDAYDALMDKIVEKLVDEDKIREGFKDVGLDEVTMECVIQTYSSAFRDGYTTCADSFKEVYESQKDESNDAD